MLAAISSVSKNKCAIQVYLINNNVCLPLVTYISFRPNTEMLVHLSQKNYSILARKRQRKYW